MTKLPELEALRQRAEAAFGPVDVLVANAGGNTVKPHLVNCIAPETILTEKTDAQIPAPQKAKLIESHPIRRLDTPEDVAEAALYLASQSASWVSGVVLDVAGGSVLAR